MKKTIYFAKQHVVKDKIKSFAVNIHPDYGAMVVIKFIDGSTEEEYFKHEDFGRLRRDFDAKSLRFYENDPIGFAKREFDIPECNVAKADSDIRKNIQAIEAEYYLLEKELLEKAERRMREVMKEHEAE